MRSMMSVGKKFIFGALGFVLALVLAGAIGMFVVAPNVARSMVRERLDRVEARAGVDIEVASIETIGIGGVELRDISVTDPKTGRKLVTVGRAGARIDRLAALTGKRVIRDVWTENVEVRITREANGDFDVVRLLEEARRNRGPATPSETESNDGGGLLRHFGGTLPTTDVQNVRVHFDAEPGAPVFPLRSLSIPSGEIDDDDGIAVRSVINVESNESKLWSVPSKVEVELHFDDALNPEQTTVKFDRAVELGGVEPFPFLRGGFGGIDIDAERRVNLLDLHLGFQSGSGDGPFITAKRIGISVKQLSTSLRKLKLGDVVVDGARVDVSFDAQGAGELPDLDHAIRAPRARHVRTRALEVAEQIARSLEKNKPEPLDEDEADDNAEPEEKPAPTPPTEPEDDLFSKLADRLPERIIITNASAQVRDGRNLPVVSPATLLQLEGGNLEVTNRPEDGEFRFKGSFEALGDGHRRGKAHGLVGLKYTTGDIEADVEVDALDLSWLAQMAGPRVAEKLRGGTLRTKVGLKPAGGRAVVVEGLVSLSDATFYWHRLAEEPVTHFNASYNFSAKYDPVGRVPAARLLKHALFKDGREPPPDDPVHRGSLVFTKGAVNVGNVAMSVVPSMYGLAALPRKLPARFDLRVKLPVTDVMTLFDAVPRAILGPLAGTQMAGTFGWDFDLEVPLHRAGEMQWQSLPALEEFELIALPPEVDVRKLMSGFKLTISTTLTDKKGEEYEWERTVRIPEAKPIPARFIVENGGIELEVLDARRREREWPPVPDPEKSFFPRVTLESPEYWYTTAAERTQAPKPWKSGDIIERSEEEPYGPYVFVPLQHISPFVTRMVMTTEDNGFFRHPGFLFQSIKESVEDNIEAGRFRRGASTISMQTVKNAFLDQQKLLARKAREVFLVFLMESVVDVPKARILEIYLNIIEFGPAIYGIHDASVHYFGKRPDELTVGEVAWLFSVVPSPKRYHVYWDRGEISERWFAKMKRYVNAMHRRGRITEEERDAALEKPPEFYRPTELDPVLKPKEPRFPALDFIPLLE